MSKSKPEPNADERLGAAVRAIVERTGGIVIERVGGDRFSCSGAESVEPGGAVSWLPEVNARTVDTVALFASRMLGVPAADGSVPR